MRIGAEGVKIDAFARLERFVSIVKARQRNLRAARDHADAGGVRRPRIDFGVRQMIRPNGDRAGVFDHETKARLAGRQIAWRPIDQRQGGIGRRRGDDRALDVRGIGRQAAHHLAKAPIPIQPRPLHGGVAARIGSEGILRAIGGGIGQPRCLHPIR